LKLYPFIASKVPVLGEFLGFSGVTNYISKTKIDTRFINKLESMSLIRKRNNYKFTFTRVINIFLNKYDDLSQQVVGLETSRE